MDQKIFNTQKLLSRTALTISFEVFLQEVSRQYPEIGQIVSYEPVNEGYEAANFYVTSNSGEYVIKIFEKNREKSSIDSMVKILVEGEKIQLPITKLIEGKQGVLSEYKDANEFVYYYMTKRFPGVSFDYLHVTLEDMRNVCQILAKLHTLTFTVAETYDSWGSRNLIQEFDKAHISDAVRQTVLPVTEELKKIALDVFSQSVIHGDIQTKHVFKSKTGDYCLIDFGCMMNGAKVLDFSIFIAWFCFKIQNIFEWEQILKAMLDVYCKTHALSEEEIKSIPTLVRASYAAYFLKTSQLIDDGDHSQETLEWNSSARKLLDLAKKFNPVF